jgi:ferredoxin--NADP+ reductase
VLDPAIRSPLPGLYVAGWIKRGPTGVIGTNKPDVLETVEAMLEDRAAGRLLQPAFPDVAAAEATVRAGEPRCVTYGDWSRLDRLEVERGRPAGRPRVKLTSVEDMLAALRGA